MVAEVRFELGRSLKFHKQSNVDVAVDVWRIDTRRADAQALSRGRIAAVGAAPQIRRRRGGRLRK